MGRLSETIADVVVGAGRVVSRALPARVKKRVEDRIFYAIFQVTRVTNDAYGWRPPDAPRQE